MAVPMLLRWCFAPCALLLVTPLMSDAAAPVAIAVHGGAGTIERSELTATEAKAIQDALEEALRAGHQRLLAGDSSLDAIESAIVILEDSAHFNAGHGAVFNANGINELDASIMDGRTLAAGAIAGVRHIRNPIRLARRVMSDSGHVMLSGEGAEEFALMQGFELVPGSYFRTERRWRELEKARAEERAVTAGAPRPAHFGTVGAVALDRNGNLAAGTSTGGMTNKRFGRIGDSPVIGAGTYADNETCAVSSTGHGEYFIRAVAAHDIAAMMRYRGKSLAEAASELVHRKLPMTGGSGGVIAIDGDGNISMPHNTNGMYRGSIDVGGRLVTAIYAD